MPYEIIDHVADVRIRVSGSSLEEVFSTSVAALVDVLRPVAIANGEPRHRAIDVEADDATLLLVDFLNEALWRMLAYRESYDRVAFKALSETRIVAIVDGAAVEAFGDDVKAVTYHEAELKRNDSGMWETLLVFDI